MLPGATVAERFVVEAPAGAGGMGTVYRARDLVAGGHVALKILRGSTGPDAAPAAAAVERFAREGVVLAELAHAAIVRYVAHGATADGAAYLAMEWLEGQPLARRLLRGPALTLAESVTLVGRVAAALAHAHARGVVHRDVKPSNLFLVDDDPARVKVLDFGLARYVHADHDVTATGVVVGTWSYMSPEQALARRDVDARTDVFSLGCVLYECLAGRRAFRSDHASAILAKILLEDPPRVDGENPAVPAALADLVAEMLAKRVDARPRDGAAVSARLHALPRAAAVAAAAGPDARDPAMLDAGADPTAASTVPAGPAPALTTSEQRVVWVVLAAPAVAHRSLSGAAADAPATAGSSSLTVELHAGERALRAALRPFDARLDFLADGTVLATFTGEGAAPMEAARRAARSALAMRAAAPDKRFALATGLADLSARTPVGEVLEQAFDALERTAPGAIGLQRHAAALLSSHFDLRVESADEPGGAGAAVVLLAARAQPVAVRTLLGRPTTCVGRERELATLAALFDECTSEPAARVAVITGPAGGGKSRVRHEFLRRLAARSDGEHGGSGGDGAAGARGEVPEPDASTVVAPGAVSVLLARGDSLSAGSPFGLLADAMRAWAGVRDGEPPEVQRHKLRARTADAALPPRTLAFLGELARVPFPDDDEPALRAARRDPALMGDAMRAAWEDWLSAECARHPVLLVLEDLHWGDLPTVRFVDAALRHLADRPFMVLAVARPEVETRFPGLWRERHPQQILLGPLGRKASETLVREVLGADVPAATVARVVERAGGNAFFLEELIRVIAEGPARGGGTRGPHPPSDPPPPLTTRPAALPGTVLAMVQSRLESLEPEARRVLRAAAVFGERFWRGGVAALLGGPGALPELDAQLAVLTAREVVTARRDAVFPGETEYVFRHALVRDATYALLTARDRELGHRLAGAWLERVGELDALVLAEHFERGGEPARAVRWLTRGAEQALEGNDLGGAIALARRAGRLARETPDAAAPLALIEAEAQRWRGEYGPARERALAAAAALPVASARWFAAAGEVIASSSTLGEHELAAQWALRVAGETAPSAARPAQVVGLARGVTALLEVGRTTEADALVARAAQLLSEERETDPAARAFFYGAVAMRGLCVGDLGAFMAATEAALGESARAGDARNVCTRQTNLGYACAELGDFARSEQHLREALASAERLGLPMILAYALNNLGLALAAQGRLDEARGAEQRAVELGAQLNNPRLVGSSRGYLAAIALRAGDAALAETHASAAVDALRGAPTLLAPALATLARALLARGDAPAARAAAEEAAAAMAAAHGVEDGEALVRLVHAEALAADGAPEPAREVIAAAAARLRARAERITDPAWRESFLTRVPDNARTLELARAWGPDARER